MACLVTYIQVSFTYIQVSLTYIQVSFTYIQVSLTYIQVSLTYTHVSVTYMQVSFTYIQVSFTSMQIFFAHMYVSFTNSNVYSMCLWNNTLYSIRVCICTMENLRHASLQTYRSILYLYGYLLHKYSLFYTTVDSKQDPIRRDKKNNAFVQPVFFENSWVKWSVPRSYRFFVRQVEEIPDNPC